MKSFPKHFMIAIAMFVVAAFVGGGLWFWTGAKLSDSLDQKAQLERQINVVSVKGIYPSKSNLDKLTASTEEINELIGPVEKSVEETSELFVSVRGAQDEEGNYQGVSANEWKRLLSQKRDGVLALAGQKNVQLPEVFYLGFDRYRVLTPPEKATYHLGVQLLAINELLTLAFNSGVTEFVEVNRVFTEDDASGGDGNGLAAKIAKGPKDWYSLYPFELKFKGVANSVSELTNQIISSPYYFIIRSIDVENEKTSVPRRAEVESEASGEDAQKNIIPIVGQENIKVTVRLDLLLWELSDDSVEKQTEKGAKK